jgi:hypothetical protein
MPRLRIVELYLHSSVCLHGIVLKLSTGRTLPFFLSDIIRVMTSTRISWAGHVGHMSYKRSAYEVFIRNCGRRDTRKTKELMEGKD